MTSGTTGLITEITATRASPLDHRPNTAVDKAGRKP